MSFDPQAWVFAAPRSGAGSKVLRSRALIALALAAALAASVTGCGGQKRVGRSRVPVAVATVKKRAVPYALAATGTVEAIRTAQVGSQVGGVITKVSFREGQEVDEGDLLFQLDPRPFRAALDQARAALQRDRAQAEIAQANADRARATFDQKLISQADWDAARTASETASANVLADSAAVQNARLNLEYASIRAPISGQTGRLMVHEGDLVKAATSDPLVTINEIHPVRVAFTVPDKQVAMVQRYRDRHPVVTVRLSPSDSVGIDGALAFVDNAVDVSSGTLLLKGEFANRDGRLIPGQFVDVRLVLYVEANALVVPDAAVTNGQQGTFVYVMNPDSTVAPRPVSVERTMDDMVVVKDGLQPGDIVVTDGQLRLSPGAKVMVRRESSPKS
jgi:multidrug efflux system membrane fusion protein